MRRSTASSASWPMRRSTMLPALRLAPSKTLRVCAGLKRVRPFIIAAGWRPTAETDRIDLRQRLVPRPEQMSLF